MLSSVYLASLGVYVSLRYINVFRYLEKFYFQMTTMVGSELRKCSMGEISISVQWGCRGLVGCLLEPSSCL